MDQSILFIIIFPFGLSHDFTVCMIVVFVVRDCVTKSLLIYE